jgi:microcystin-dependent protein
MPNQVYFATGLPPGSGSGTITSPYSSDQFDSILNSYTKATSPVVSPLDIYLGPGTYDTYGNYIWWYGAPPYDPNKGFNLGTGWRLIGSGMGVTTIRLAEIRYTSPSTSFGNSPIVSLKNAENIEIRDLTVDCNTPNIAGTPTAASFIQPSGTTQVLVQVGDTSKLIVNTYVVIQSNATSNITHYGTYRVASIPSSTTVYLENLAHLGGGVYDAGVAAGSTVPSNQILLLYASIAAILLSTTNSRVENVRIINAASTAYENPFLLFSAQDGAIHTGNVARSVIIDQTWGLWGTAIQFNGDGGTVSGIIEDCIVNGNGYTGHGIGTGGVQRTMVVNNVVTGCLYGFYNDYQNIDSLIVAGNTFSDFPTAPVARQNSPTFNPEVIGFKIGGGGYTFQNLQLNNNILVLPTPSGGTTICGFYLWQGVSFATVQNNIISGTNGTGILADSNATAIMVSGNQISPPLLNSIASNVSHELLDPPGTMVDYAGVTPPPGWLLCYGQEVSRTSYARLFTAIGTTYGSGNGTTTFNLPDCRGRVSVGKDDMGGTAINRITVSGCGIDGKTLGSAGGVQSNTAVPAHTHSMGGAPLTSVSFNNNSTSGGASVRCNAVNGFSTTTTFSNSNTGSTGNASISNVQPTIILQKIIKY